MAQLIVVYWRDIPSQVIAQKSRREQVKTMLPDRFQVAIDAAAMRGGAGDTDSYLQEWRKSAPEDCSEDLESEARTRAARLEQDYDKDRLRALVQNGGKSPE
ncbi:MAG: virulence factor [Rhodovibrionaceae bacterium]